MALAEKKLVVFASMVLWGFSAHYSFGTLANFGQSEMDDITQDASISQHFDVWLEMFLQGETEDCEQFLAQHARWQQTRNNKLPSPATLLARAIDSNGNLYEGSEARKAALRAISEVRLSEAELRDPVLRDLMKDQFCGYGPGTHLFTVNSFGAIPAEDQWMWYPCASRKLRSESLLFVRQGLDAVIALRALAGNDREYLQQLLVDIEKHSPRLGEATDVSAKLQKWQHFSDRVRPDLLAKVTTALLVSSRSPEETIDSLRSITNQRTRLAIARGIIDSTAMFFAEPLEKHTDLRGVYSHGIWRESESNPKWTGDQIDQLFDLLDDILAEPTAAIIVLSGNSAELHGPGDRSLLSSMLDYAERLGGAAQSRMVASGLEAAQSHGGNELREKFERLLLNADLADASNENTDD